MKVLKAGKLLYEDGGFMLDGWSFGPDVPGGPIELTGMIDAALEFVLEERQAFAEADQHANIRTLNAERLMIDAIQQAKK